MLLTRKNLKILRFICFYLLIISLLFFSGQFSFYFFSLILLLLIFEYINKKEYFNPIIGFSLGFIIYFCIPYFFFNNGYYQYILDYKIKLFIISSFFSYLIGSFMFSLLFLKKRRNNFFIIQKLNFSQKKLKILGVIIIFVKILHLLSGYKTTIISAIGKSGIADIFIVFINITTFVYMNLISYFILKIKKSKTLLLLFFCILFLDIFYGSKFRILLDFSPLIFWYLYFYKTLSIKYIIVLFVIILISFSFSLAIRTHKYLAYSNSFSQIGYLAVILLKNYSFHIFDLIIGRLNMLEPLIRIFDNKNLTTKFLSHYPLNNTIFPLFFISFIPRFIWHNRIDSNPGGYFGYVFGWTSSYKDAYVSASLIGEFFINFSWYSLLLIFCLGFLHQLIYQIFFNKSRKFIFKIIYLYFFIYVVLSGVESYFVIRYNIFIKNSILMFLIYTIIFQILKVHRKKKV